MTIRPVRAEMTTIPTVRVEFDISKIQKLTRDDITHLIESATHPDECETWQWLFGIQERYKGKLCKKRGARAWLNTVLKDSKNYNKTPQELLFYIRNNTAADPFLDDGFLKLATLEACDSAGLLEDLNHSMSERRSEILERRFRYRRTLQRQVWCEERGQGMAAADR